MPIRRGDSSATSRIELYLSLHPILQGIEQGMSQQVAIGDFSAVYSWDGMNKPQYQNVYLGKITATGYIPGRQWADRILEYVDLATMF